MSIIGNVFHGAKKVIANKPKEKVLEQKPIDTKNFIKESPEDYSIRLTKRRKQGG